jgi:hypothetical protein
MLLLAALALSLHTPPKNIERRIDGLLAKMTLEEKFGQMSQEGIPYNPKPEFYRRIRDGLVGSVYGGGSASLKAGMQREARRAGSASPSSLAPTSSTATLRGFRFPSARPLPSIPISCRPAAETRPKRRPPPAFIGPSRR